MSAIVDGNTVGRTMTATFVMGGIGRIPGISAPDVRSAGSGLFPGTVRMRAARHPFRFGQRRERGPPFHCFGGRRQAMVPSAPFRIGLHEPSQQDRRGVRIAQRAMRVVVGDAEVFAAVGELAPAKQCAGKLHRAQHGALVHRYPRAQAGVFGQQEFRIERDIVRDEHASCEQVAQFMRDAFEIGRVQQFTRGDVMHP